MSERPDEMDERDVDARFASIVAAWEGTGDTDDDTPDGPNRPDGPSASAPATEEESPERPPTVRPPWVNPPLDLVVPASAWRAAEAPEPRATEESAGDAADEEHFEPPAVHLPPQEDLHFWGAVAGLVAGPLCLLYVAIARPFHSTRWFVAGLALSLLGFGLLVLRQPRHRDEDDDGARL